MTTTTTIRMRQRRGSSAEWAAANPILGDGELGFNKDTDDIKVGDGVTPWLGLPYLFERTSIYDAKGDLIVGTGADASARLPRGTTNQKLTTLADGSLGWVDPYLGADKVTKAGDTMSGALLMNQNVAVLYGQASGNQAYIMGQGTTLNLRGGTSGFQLKNNGDTQAVVTIGNTGLIVSHGALTGLELHGRDNDAQSYLNYVTGNSWRVWTSTGDRLTVDSAGALIAASSIHAFDSQSGLVNSSGGRPTLYGYHGLEIRGGRVSATIPTPTTGGGSGDPSVTILSPSAGQRGLVVKAFASQSAYLTEWQRSDGVLLSAIDQNGNLKLQTIGNANIELGDISGAASTPFIDFHSSATAVDYDVRLIASGGNGTIGRGVLTATVGNLTINTNPVSGPGFVLQGAAANRSAEIMLKDTTSNLSKYIRNNGGNLQFCNDAYTTVLLSIDNSGNLVGLSSAALAIGYINDPALTGAYLQTDPAATNSGAILINTRAAANKGLIIQEASGQSADPFQILDSTLAVQRAAIDSGGGIFGSAAYFGSRVSYGTLTVTPQSSVIIGEVIRGVTSQSADLMQFQNVSAGVLTKITSDGSIATQSNVAIGVMTPYLNNARLSIKNVAGDTGSVNLAIQALTSQTADLVQVLDPIGAILTKINPSGWLTTARLFLTDQVTTTTAPTGGAAGALPSNPVGYMTLVINGNVRKIPYYS